MAGLGVAGQGAAGLGWARRGLARQGGARPGKAGQGKVFFWEQCMSAVERTTTIIGQKRAETVKLIERMKDGKQGDRIADEDLRRLVGKSCAPGGEAYGYLMSAMRYCLKEHDASWERDRGTGSIICQGPSEARNSVASNLRSCRRRTNRDLRRLRVTCNGNMEDGERQQHNVLIAQVGAVAAMSDLKTTRKLEARNITQPLDMNRLLEAFKQNGN
jgi:hypothetical protein